ncbi:hypothetical protein DFH06DRAFT_476213 [Mycena polygramma]|nr:hypothetical protein DFH06DRAFT_476213 [Mycena polygramma]
MVRSPHTPVDLNIYILPGSFYLPSPVRWRLSAPAVVWLTGPSSLFVGGVPRRPVRWAHSFYPTPAPALFALGFLVVLSSSRTGSHDFWGSWDGRVTRCRAEPLSASVALIPRQFLPSCPIAAASVCARMTVLLDVRVYSLLSRVSSSSVSRRSARRH